MAVELLELKIALRKGRVVTTLQYADVEAAIDWLRRVFGMELKLRVDGDDGRPEHAQLLHGHEVVMLGPYADTQYGRLLRKPGDLGGCETQAPYLVVPDADVIWQRVRDAGGEIVIDIVDQSYGGRGFTCRDPQGHLWNVGTYDPFAA
ncbi:MAG: VOC family protein [Gammaproteobacteria bacterium]|nr:VOC family protein [Gammaproteobacteria bacterium]